MLSFIEGGERREADTIKRQSDPRLLLPLLLLLRRVAAAARTAETLNLAV